MSKRLTAGILGVSIALSACQSDGVRPRAPQLESEKHLTDLGRRLDTAQNALQEFQLSSAGATDAADGQVERHSNSQQSDTANVQSRAMAQDYPGKLRDYLDLRRNQVDGHCALFFGQLSEIKNQARYGRDLFNIGSEFASIALGLAGTSANQLAVLSGLQLSINDTFDATERVLLLSPDPHKVFELVRQEQAAVTAVDPSSFTDAERQVRNYAHPCTFIGIQATIDQVLSAEIARRAQNPDSEDVRATLENLRDILNRTGTGEAVASIPGDNIVDLYILFVLNPADAQRAQALNGLPPAVRQRAEAALSRTDDATSIRNQLQTLAERSTWIAVNAQGRRLAAEQAGAIETTAQASVAREIDRIEPRITEAEQTANQAQTAADNVGDRVAELEKQLQCLRDARTPESPEQTSESPEVAEDAAQCD